VCSANRATYQSRKNIAHNHLRTEIFEQNEEEMLYEMFISVAISKLRIFFFLPTNVNKTKENARYHRYQQIKKKIPIIVFQPI